MSADGARYAELQQQCVCVGAHGILKYIKARTFELRPQGAAAV